LLEEIKALSKLRNPNIVELLDVIYTEKYYYLVYEYCDAGDLQKHLKKVRVFDDKDCL
jgi:serine/threonine protein kinase